MRLETDRLILRPFTQADAEIILPHFADPDFMIWSIDGTLDAAAGLKKMNGWIACQEASGFSKYAMFEKKGHNFAGYCGLNWEDIEGSRQPELGFRLVPTARGRGLAREAAEAVLDDAFTRLDMPLVYAFADKDNLPSRRLLERLGMTDLKRIISFGSTTFSSIA
ncbi:MAG: GNAT family N-acetyltransferase [Pseudomonadota bacterium]